MIEENVLKSFSGGNALVTGGTGLIGRQVVDILCHAGAKVKVVSMDRIKVNKLAEHIFGDLTSFEFCEDITKNMDFVLHLAGIKGSVEVTKAKPASFFVPLLMMNTNVLEACRLNQVRKVVYTSSIGAYASAEVLRETENLEGPPMDMFPGWAKRMAELQIQAYKIQYNLNNFSIVRPCNVYGPGDNFELASANFIPAMIVKVGAAENEITIWGSGKRKMQFIFIDDLVRNLLAVGQTKKENNVFVFGNNEAATVEQIVKKITQIFGKKLVIKKDLSQPDKPTKTFRFNNLVKPRFSLSAGLAESIKYYQNRCQKF